MIIGTKMSKTYSSYRKRQSMKATIIRPRYAETDQMGVVYHGNYFTYFEVARSDFFRQAGYTYKALEDQGIIMPVLECNCRFLRPVLYDEAIAIRTQCTWNGKIKVRFDYEIVNEETEVVLASGFTLHTFVDKQLKPVRAKDLNPAFVELLKQFMEVAQ